MDQNTILLVLLLAIFTEGADINLNNNTNFLLLLLLALNGGGNNDHHHHHHDSLQPCFPPTTVPFGNPYPF